jgi:uncharacterized membrane protein
MATVEKAIEVNVPLETAYNQWTQFEEFPRFMEGVEEVNQLDDDRLYWKADIGGETKEWHARITRQVPDEVIAWESEGGAVNSGMVAFVSKGENKTEIKLRLAYEPEGLKEQVGDALGVLSRQVESDLERFKQFIETRGMETGAWRGEIPGEVSDTAGRYGASGQGGSGYGGTAQGTTTPGTPGTGSEYGGTGEAGESNPDQPRGDRM